MLNDLRYSKQSNKVARRIWQSMHDRCYKTELHTRRPTYAGCVVCEDWHTFSKFITWFDANYIPGNSLDKDILVRGNKVYSPETCAFVPNYINNLINLRDYKLPVYRHGNQYRYHLGMESGIVKVPFATREQAIIAYCVAKESRVRHVALEAFLANHIRSDVYLALAKWTVFNG